MRSFIIIILFFAIRLFNLSPLNAQSGGALDFDGVNDYVNLGNIAATNFGTSNFTIEFWLKTSQVSTVNVVIMSKRSDCNCSNFWNIIMESNGQLRYEASQNNSCLNYAVLNTTIAVNDGQWRHFAFVRNGTNVSIYINGSLNNTAILSLANLSNSDQVHLGRSACSDQPWANYLDGQMDEVRIWNFNRTPTQISTNMNCSLSGSETGLIAYYTFNQGIADGNNAGINTLTALAGPTGTLTNFALNGTSSNWVTGIAVLSPVFSSCPANINQNTDSGVCTAVVTYTATATGTPSPTYTYAFSGDTPGSGSGTGSGAVFNKGTTTVTITATNACGSASCSFNITVVDNALPMVSCKVAEVFLNEMGMGNLMPEDLFSSGSDNCGTVNLQSVTPNSFTCNTLGFNFGTLVVNDGNGNTNDCISAVLVRDNMAPSITLTGNASESLCLGTGYTDAGATAIDNCSGNVTGNIVTVNPVNVNIPGIYTITYNVSDAVGNPATQVTRTVQVYGYSTIAVGDYSSPSTWAGGCVPQNPIPSGVTVMVNHDLTNDIELTNNGIINATGRIFTNTASGTYKGTGTITGEFINNGTFNPGN